MAMLARRHFLLIIQHPFFSLPSKCSLITQCLQTHCLHNSTKTEHTSLVSRNGITTACYQGSLQACELRR